MLTTVLFSGSFGLSHATQFPSINFYSHAKYKELRDRFQICKQQNIYTKYPASLQVQYLHSPDVE